MNNVITLNGISRLRAWPIGVVPFGIARSVGLQELLSKFHGLEVFSDIRHNLLVTSGKDLVAKMLNDEEDTGLTYHAIGSGATAPAVGDTQLTSEGSRKTWTSKVRTGSTISFSVFYLAAESTLNVKECGVFGGASASATPDSGIMFSHYLQAYDNSAGLVDLTFEYEVSVGAA